METRIGPHFADGIVNAVSRSPWRTVLGALLLMVSCLLVASRLELRTELLELLPRDSPGFKAYEHQSGRMGGGSGLTVIVASPTPKANERFVDALAERLQEKVRQDGQCIAKCAPGDAACVNSCAALISYFEATSKDLHSYYASNKWLYASLPELQKAEEDLDWNIAVQSGMVEDLSGPLAASSSSDIDSAKLPTPVSPSPSPSPALAAAAPQKNAALGLRQMLAQWDAATAKKDSYPTGYFSNPASSENAESTQLAIRIVANTSLGGAGGDRLLAEVMGMVATLNPASFDAQMEIGYTGDIASASDEKKALISEAAWATIAAALLIMAGLVLYYRSVWALPIIFLPAVLGVSVAYAFAMAVFGYINASGAFLGAIILGNGINYPIVLLSRYQDFRAHGVPPEQARRSAVANAFRAELVGACVAAIAYGSLSVTRFRGFSQFGVIGFVGMLLVWIAIVPLVPAMLVLTERMQARLPTALAWLRERPVSVREDGARSGVISWIAEATTRRPKWFLGAGAVLFCCAALQLPSYLRDPWEYNFDKLGSKNSQVTGASFWMRASLNIFGRGNNIAGAAMLADNLEQVPKLKKQILENDAKDPQGKMLSEITTIYDLLPGTPHEQQAKLEVLDSIRSKLTERVVSQLSPQEQRDVALARPPETLRVLSPQDLPALIRRRFTESNGTVGTVFYIAPLANVFFTDGHNHLRMSATIDNVTLPDGTQVMTASRSSIFAEMLKSMRRDGPLASGVAFGLVSVVVLLASRSKRSAFAVLLSLLFGATILVGGAAFGSKGVALNWGGHTSHFFQSETIHINYINFIAIPITLGIGCEYPFNIADRVRLLGGDVATAVKRSAGAVLLCSFSTVVGYGSMMYSDFQALESFGKLAVFGELACVFGAVFFLPSLLTVVAPKSKDEAI